VTQEDDCLRVQWGGNGCAAGEEVSGTNIVVNNEVMMRVRWRRQKMLM